MENTLHPLHPKPHMLFSQYLAADAQEISNQQSIINDLEAQIQELRAAMAEVQVREQATRSAEAACESAISQLRLSLGICSALPQPRADAIIETLKAEVLATFDSQAPAPQLEEIEPVMTEQDAAPDTAIDVASAEVEEVEVAQVAAALAAAEVAIDQLEATEEEAADKPRDSVVAGVVTLSQLKAAKVWQLRDWFREFSGSSDEPKALLKIELVESLVNKVPASAIAAAA